jgi:hypothetical protein
MRSTSDRSPYTLKCTCETRRPTRPGGGELVARSATSASLRLRLATSLVASTLSSIPGYASQNARMSGERVRINKPRLVKRSVPESRLSCPRSRRSRSRTSASMRVADSISAAPAGVAT